MLIIIHVYLFHYANLSLIHYIIYITTPYMVCPNTKFLLLKPSFMLLLCLRQHFFSKFEDVTKIHVAIEVLLTLCTFFGNIVNNVAIELYVYAKILAFVSFFFSYSVDRSHFKFIHYVYICIENLSLHKVKRKNTFKTLALIKSLDICFINIEFKRR